MRRPFGLAGCRGHGWPRRPAYLSREDEEPEEEPDCDEPDCDDEPLPPLMDDEPELPRPWLEPEPEEPDEERFLRHSSKSESNDFCRSSL